MKTLAKSLFVWLLLLALPFQGFAAATMLPCAPMQPSAAMTTASMTMGSPHHDHQQMLAAQKAQQDGGQHDAQDSTSGQHHDGKNCKSCSACCPGNLMATSLSVAVLAPHFTAIPFKTGFVPVVEVALPERPPQTSLA